MAKELALLRTRNLLGDSNQIQVGKNASSLWRAVAKLKVPDWELTLA
jgi:hypothetical protein